MDLGDRLRAAILGAGVSVYQVAQRSGVCHPTLSRFLSGERDIRLGTASKLAAFLGLELTPTKAAPTRSKPAPTRKPKTGRK